MVAGRTVRDLTFAVVAGADHSVVRRIAVRRCRRINSTTFGVGVRNAGIARIRTRQMETSRTFRDRAHAARVARSCCGITGRITVDMSCTTIRRAIHFAVCASFVRMIIRVTGEFTRG